jgi:transcriptional regulator with XRE-family HTH domain
MSDFARSLKSWRETRRFSQLALALEAEVSARHISFLETGRARPSREMILRLGAALDLPLGARNALLTQAGFAARYAARDWQAEEMAPIRAAMAHLMERHAPYPAIALDRHWRLVMLNAPARRLYAPFGLSEGESLLALILSGALSQAVENWPQVAHHTALRLRAESAALGGDEVLEAAAAELARVPQPETLVTEAVVPIRLALGEMRLALFGTIAQFGTPEDVTLEALRIELFFPADASSRAVLEGLAG